MIGAVLSGSVLGMLAGLGCLIAGLPALLALAVWSGTGTLVMLLLSLVPLWHRRRALAALVPQRS